MVRKYDRSNGNGGGFFQIIFAELSPSIAPSDDPICAPPLIHVVVGNNFYVVLHTLGRGGEILGLYIPANLLK